MPHDFASTTCANTDFTDMQFPENLNGKNPLVSTCEEAIDTLHQIERQYSTMAVLLEKNCWKI